MEGTVIRKWGRKEPRALPPHRMLTRSLASGYAPAVDLRKFDGPIKDQGEEGCHCEKTDVLTEAGWVPWPEYRGDTLLATVNQATGLLEYQMPTSLVQHEYDGEMFVADHASLDFKLTPGHRMYRRKWDERERALSGSYGFTPISDIGFYSGLLASPAGFLGTQLEQVAIGQRSYFGDDFIALLALVASDGWVGGTENNRNTVSFCCFNESRRPRVEALAHRLQVGEVPSRRGVWKFSDAALAHWLRANMFVGDCYRSPFKRIPNIVKCSSSAQIMEFLSFFGDKHVRDGDDNGRQFYTSSPRMADDVQELCLKIGKRCSVSKPKPARDVTMSDGRMVHADNCADSFTLTEWGVSNLSLERKSQIHRERYIGTVFCATVPNSTLITRRNGTVLISGNSCTGHAFTESGETIYRMYPYWLPKGAARDPLFSPQYFYARELILDGNFPTDDGSDGETGCNVATQFGLCPLADYPYVAGQIVKPTTAQDAAARPYMMGAYHGLSGSLSAISVLGDPTPWPVQVGFTVMASFESDEVATTGIYNPQPNEQAVGGHEVKLSGYDIGSAPTLRPANCPPAVLVQNSWGESWGLKGYFWMVLSVVDSPDTDLKIVHSGHPWVPTVKA